MVRTPPDALPEYSGEPVVVCIPVKPISRGDYQMQTRCRGMMSCTAIYGCPHCLDPLSKRLIGYDAAEEKSEPETPTPRFREDILAQARRRALLSLERVLSDKQKVELCAVVNPPVVVPLLSGSALATLHILLGVINKVFKDFEARIQYGEKSKEAAELRKEITDVRVMLRNLTTQLHFLQQQRDIEYYSIAQFAEGQVKSPRLKLLDSEMATIRLQIKDNQADIDDKESQLLRWTSENSAYAQHVKLCDDIQLARGRAERGADLLGNGCRTFLKHRSQYVLILTTSDDAQLQTYAIQFRTLTDYLSEISDLFRHDILDKTQRDRLRVLAAELPQFLRRYFPGLLDRSFKLHQLEAHSASWADVFGSFGRYCEQSLEHYGQRLKRAINSCKRTKDPQARANEVQRILEHAQLAFFMELCPNRSATISASTG